MWFLLALCECVIDLEALGKYVNCIVMDLEELSKERESLQAGIQECSLNSESYCMNSSCIGFHFSKIKRNSKACSYYETFRLECKV